MIYLNTEHLARCIQTLRASLELFEGAPDNSTEAEVFRNAIVKGYELAQETAFKLLRKALREYGYSSRTLNQTPIKDVLRLGAKHGLLSTAEVERWFRYRDNRNSTAHDYGEGFAKETLTLIPGFLADVTALRERLEEKLGEERA